MNLTKFIAGLTGLLLIGCINHEPYPGWDVSEIPFSEVPPKVQQAYNADRPNQTPSKIERSTLENRNLGYPSLYKFETAGKNPVIYDREGRISQGLEFWFPSSHSQPQRIEK